MVAAFFWLDEDCNPGWEDDCSGDGSVKVFSRSILPLLAGAWTEVVTGCRSQDRLEICGFAVSNVADKHSMHAVAYPSCPIQTA